MPNTMDAHQPVDPTPIGPTRAGAVQAHLGQPPAAHPPTAVDTHAEDAKLTLRLAPSLSGHGTAWRADLAAAVQLAVLDAFPHATGGEVAGPVLTLAVPLKDIARYLDSGDAGR